MPPQWTIRCPVSARHVSTVSASAASIPASESLSIGRGTDTTDTGSSGWPRFQDRIPRSTSSTSVVRRNDWLARTSARRSPSPVCTYRSSAGPVASVPSMNTARNPACSTRPRRSTPVASTDSRAVRTADATPTTSARANASGTATVASPVSGNGRTFAANHGLSSGSSTPVPLMRFLPTALFLRGRYELQHARGQGEPGRAFKTTGDRHRCPILRVDHRHRTRLVEIPRNLTDRDADPAERASSHGCSCEDERSAATTGRTPHGNGQACV